MGSCTGILCRVFLSWCPPPSTVVTQFDSLSLSFADPWWKVIHDFIAYIYIYIIYPTGLDVSTSQFSRGMERGLPWDVKWLQVRRTVVWEKNPWPEAWPSHPPPWGLCHLALQATTHAGGSSDAGRGRQANTTTSCNTATGKELGWRKLRSGGV